MVIQIQIHLNVINFFVFSESCRLIAFFIASIIAISCFLIANINVVLIVIQTFDFWFKMYNFVCTMVAWSILQSSGSTGVKNNIWFDYIMSNQVADIPN